MEAIDFLESSTTGKNRAQTAVKLKQVGARKLTNELRRTRAPDFGFEKWDGKGESFKREGGVSRERETLNEKKRG
jgi:hypothetical protein